MNALRTLKTKLILVFILLFITALSIGLCCLSEPNANAYAETTSSIFTFAPVSDTECSVRLGDKTASIAIIPETAEINGQIYSVTEIASNGFSSLYIYENSAKATLLFKEQCYLI